MSHFALACHRLGNTGSLYGHAGHLYLNIHVQSFGNSILIQRSVSYGLF
jgi:hypothetical protein